MPEIVDTLVSGGKTLRGSIAQNTYGSEIKALRELLDRLTYGGKALVETSHHAQPSPHPAKQHLMTMLTGWAPGCHWVLVWSDSPTLSWLHAHPIR